MVQQGSFADSDTVPPASTWVFPTLGITHRNKQATENAKEEVRRIRGLLDAHLRTRTFLVGERVTLAAGPKAEDPFARLPESTSVLDEFRRRYSNEDAHSTALPYCWEHFDQGGWSLGDSEYRFPEELTQTFMSCNLITGMFQRLDKLRKSAFASVILFGTNNSSSISGAWVFRGQELAFPPSLDWQVDYESYAWRKLDPGSEETQTLVREHFSWDGAFQHVGKAFNQGKIFK
ncbi:elongation factor 1-gamma-like [Hippopotamus amphibius kiboko]|uniref:elongation factor 1-gamma-like n=1 Tax=Hippopotamus amphibius kiboko TaxID=575201 RepID=UPI002592E56D|nr:elongation factor 1-gamma-like [Hippopotamus amphibius kiboko]